MNKISAFSLLLLLLFTGRINAQLSGYGSVSFGYNANPLYNYQNQSDNLKQTYLELSYLKESGSSLLKFSYVSGLMLFSSLSDRNYYEHTLSAKYGFLLGGTNNAAEALPDTASAEAEDGESSDMESSESSEEEQPADSTVSSLELYASVTARHDKEVFKEFDNNGGRILGSYKSFVSDNFSLRITNDLSIRNYSFLKELSNLTEILTFQMSNKSDGGSSYGFGISGAYKSYLTEAYDTARFETRKSYETKPGKGKGGAAVKVPSGKQILLNPLSNGTGQFSAALFYKQNIGRGIMEITIIYRYNPETRSRYLAQQTRSGLNEDIYNDFFSYQGPEASVRFNTPFILGTQLLTGIQYSDKNFGAPAFNLEGLQIADHRNDKHFYFELFMSRPLNLFTNFSADLSFGAGYVRNQSNDNYNDFSGTSFSIGLGIGF